MRRGHNFLVARDGEASQNVGTTPAIDLVMMVVEIFG